MYKYVISTFSSKSSFYPLATSVVKTEEPIDKIRTTDGYQGTMHTFDGRQTSIIVDNGRDIELHLKYKGKYIPPKVQEIVPAGYMEKTEIRITYIGKTSD